MRLTCGRLVVCRLVREGLRDSIVGWPWRDSGQKRSQDYKTLEDATKENGRFPPPEDELKIECIPFGCVRSTRRLRP